MLRKSLQPTKGHYCEDIYYPKCGALHIQLYDVLDVNPLDLVFQNSIKQCIMPKGIMPNYYAQFLYAYVAF